MSQTLDRAIDGYTNSFPNFTLIYSSPDKHLDDLPAYLIEGQYSDPRIWRTEDIRNRYTKRWYKLLYTIFCKSFTR